MISLKRGVYVGLFSRKKKEDTSVGVPKFGESFDSVPVPEPNPISEDLPSPPSPENAQPENNHELPSLDEPLYEGLPPLDEGHKEFDFHNPPDLDAPSLDSSSAPSTQPQGNDFDMSGLADSKDDRELQPLDVEDTSSEEELPPVDEAPELPALESREIVGPIFVKMDAYGEALDVLDVATEEVGECLNVSMSFFDIMTAEQKANERLQSELMAINKKLYTVDEKLFEKR